MTVTSSTNRNQYTGNGSTTIFARTFLAKAESHIKVYQTVDGVTTEVTSGIAHSGVGTTSGNVTFTTAPANGTTITIIREVPFTQETDYQSQGKVKTQQVEDDLDLQAQQAQDLNERLGRSFSAPITGKNVAEGNMVKANAEGHLIDAGVDFADIQAAQAAAEAAQAASEAAQILSEAALDSFDDRYLGVKSSDPTTDNDGDALLEGALYWSSVTERFRVYRTAAWKDAINPENLGPVLHGATSKTAPIDGDTFSLIDSAASNVLKKITWANFKVAVASYIASAAQTLTNKTINAADNTVTNLQTGMFAANVIDTDTTLIANSDTRIASQKATKAYVDTLKSGLLWKDPVDVATTANITLSGEQTIDGVMTSTSRVLVKDQTDQTENGLYLTSSGAWTRTSGGDSAAELHGASVLVQQGGTYADTQWQQQTDNITLGSSNIVWTQFGGAGTYTAGTGVELSGNAFGLSEDALKAINSLTPAADRLPYYTGAVTAALATFTSYGRTLLGLADAASLRSNLNVEDGATADQTGAEIKVAYEAEADTNAFTDNDQSKLGLSVTSYTAASFATDTLAANGDLVFIDGALHTCVSSANTPQHTNASSVKAFDLAVRQKETFDHYSAALSDGDQTPAIEGLVYVKDSALTGALHSLTASCTKDLAVDGFRAFETITPNHCGYTASSSASDAASEVKSAFYLLAGNSEIKTLDLQGQSISITQLTGLPDLTAKVVQNGTLTSSSNAHTVVDLPDLADVLFDSIKFETTAVAATDQVYGVVNSTDQAITDTVFHRCEFSAPSAFTNGFKAVNEAINTINGLVFDSCKVDNVGRLGIEFQNHNVDTVKRMDNLIVRACIIDGAGLSDATYGMGISFSGYLGACHAIGNTIRDCGAIDIEFAGGETVVMSDNIHENPVRPFGISGSSYTKKEAVIKGNSCVGYATAITYLRDVENVQMSGNSYRLNEHLEVYDVDYFYDESVWRTKGNYAIYAGLTVGELRFAGCYDTVGSTKNFATLRLDGTGIGVAVLSGSINHGATGSANDSINNAPELVRTQGSVVDGVVARTAPETFHGGITKDFFSTDNATATITFTNTATSWQPIMIEVAVQINQSSGADMGQGVILIPTRIISTPGLNRGTTQNIVTPSGVTLSVTSTTTSVTVTATAPASWAHGIAAFSFKATGRFTGASVT